MNFIYNASHKVPKKYFPSLIFLLQDESHAQMLLPKLNLVCNLNSLVALVVVLS